jgi:hypothetical protein
MDRNFPPNYYPAGTKVIYEDGTNDILRIRNYLSPGFYHLGKKVVAIDISTIPDAEARGQIENQMAEQRRIVEATEERQRATEERQRATEERRRANDAAIERVYREVAERVVAEQAEMRIWEAGAEEREERRRIAAAGAEAREERRRIEAARPYDNNNPAPAPNDQAGPDGRPHWHQPGLHWGGRKSRRGRKSKKYRKSRSKKRRARKTNRRRRRR